jgi:hypothetical protein
MGARSRSVFLASLVPAVLLGGVFAVVEAQNAGAPAKATQWSDPATWPNNKVPAAGDKVVIAKDMNVILDVDTPALGGVTIDGKLSFAENADVELTTSGSCCTASWPSAPRPSPAPARPPSPSPTT